MRRFFALLTAAAVALTGGCGTVCNLVSNTPKPYGGVDRSVETYLTVEEGLSFEAHSPKDFLAYFIVVGWISAVAGADVCVSAAADTLTYPLLPYFQGKPRPADTAARAARPDGTPLNLALAATAFPPAPPSPAADVTPQKVELVVYEDGKEVRRGPVELPTEWKYDPPPPASQEAVKRSD
jgi:uncharacterized protein YceK